MAVSLDDLEELLQDLKAPDQAEKKPKPELSELDLLISDLTASSSVQSYYASCLLFSDRNRKILKRFPSHQNQHQRNQVAQK